MTESRPAADVEGGQIAATNRHLTSLDLRRLLWNRAAIPAMGSAAGDSRCWRLRRQLANLRESLLAVANSAPILDVGSEQLGCACHPTLIPRPPPGRGCMGSHTRSLVEGDDRPVSFLRTRCRRWPTAPPWSRTILNIRRHSREGEGLAVGGGSILCGGWAVGGPLARLVDRHHPTPQLSAVQDSDQAGDRA